MFMDSLPTSPTRSSHSICRPVQGIRVLPTKAYTGSSTELADSNHKAVAVHGKPPLNVRHPIIEVSPSDNVKRRAVSWPGMTAEIIQATRHQRIEYRFR